MTYLPLDEIAELCAYRDERINKAKERLAFELTKIVHGEEDATTALKQALSAFSGDCDDIPTKEISGGINGIIDVIVEAGVAKSKSEARRLIDGGAVKVGENKVTSYELTISDSELKEGIVLHKGKKVHVKVVIK